MRNDRINITKTDQTNVETVGNLPGTDTPKEMQATKTTAKSDSSQLQVEGTSESQGTQEEMRSAQIPIEVPSGSEDGQEEMGSSQSSQSGGSNYVDKLDENFNKIQNVIDDAVKNNETMIREIDENNKLIEQSKLDEQKASKDAYDLDNYKQKEDTGELSTMAERLVLQTENKYLKQQVELLDESSQVIERTSKNLDEAKRELKNLLDYRETLTDIRVLETKGIEGKYDHQDEKRMNELLDEERQKFSALKQKNKENIDEKYDEKEQEKVDTVKQSLDSQGYKDTSHGKRKLEEPVEERESKRIHNNEDKAKGYQDSRDITSDSDPIDIFWDD